MRDVRHRTNEKDIGNEKRQKERREKKDRNKREKYPLCVCV